MYSKISESAKANYPVSRSLWKPSRKKWKNRIASNKCDICTLDQYNDWLSQKKWGQSVKVRNLPYPLLRGQPLKSWWRCENLESTYWILVWIRRRPFAGLEFMFTYFYVHFRCFKGDHNTLSLHPVYGDFVVYQSLLIPGCRKWKWRIVFENCCPLLLCFNWRKAIGCEKFQTNKEILANFRFFAQYVRNFFFPKYFFCTPSPAACPSASYGLVSVFLNDFFSDHTHL